MQPNRQDLIWALLGTLILAGMLGFILMADQLQIRASPVGIPINTPQFFSSVSSDTGDSDTGTETTSEAESTEEPTAGNITPTPEADEGDEPEEQPDGENGADTSSDAATPTSLSRVPGSIITTSVPPTAQPEIGDD